MILALLIQSYALIVTNNRSLDLGRPDLRYADDDGVQYSKLFAQGVDHVTLLTTLDVDSARLYPNLKPLPPTLANVEAALAAVPPGETVYLVFAGHGDVAHGEGFLELADDKLTAGALDTLIGRLRAAEVHLILDSCNSYFMLNPRKPGGKRFAAPPAKELSLLKRHPNLGVLISTSAEAVTYEWSEVQSGIFSYVVRSGLRGAADANGDGRVTYNELEAFAHTATGAIVNDLYRPKIFARAPTATARFLDALTARTKLIVAPGASRRLTIRDQQGVRVLDLHSEPQTSLTVALPEGNFEVQEQGRTLTIRQGQSVTLPASLATRAAIAGRGESPVFQALFARAFGAKALAAYSPPEEALFIGLSHRDVERLGLQLQTLAGFAREDRRATGFALLTGMGVGFTSAAPSALTRDWLSFGISAAVSAAFGIAGTVLLATDPAAGKLYREYAQLDLSTEAARAAAVVATGQRMYQFVMSERSKRRGFAALTLTASAIELSLATFVFPVAIMQGAQPGPMVVAGSALAASAVFLAYGLWQLIHSRTDLERMWDLYQRDGPVGAKL